MHEKVESPYAAINIKLILKKEYIIAQKTAGVILPENKTVKTPNIILTLKQAKNIRRPLLNILKKRFFLVTGCDS